MKHFESVKRIIILQLAVIGLLMQTIAYVYVWRTVYNDIMQKYMWRNFTGRGFWLLAAVYRVLLLFFTGTYGGLKIGYLKPMDVFFSQVLSLIFTNVISYFQISLLSLKLVTAYPLILMTLVQYICGLGIYLSELLQTAVPTKKAAFDQWKPSYRRYSAQV